MVTMIGIDLASRQFNLYQWPDPTRFWNRVLGRVGTVPTVTELQSGSLTAPQRDPVYVEKVIEGEIRKTGAAAAGVLLGFVVFATYWVVAGPGGFGVLKLRGWTRHAWAAFFITGIAFTAIAWGGATLIRPKRVDVTHRSYLIHVYGQPVQRSRSWMTILLPWYGDATIAVGERDDDRSVADLVTSWEPPYDGATEGGYPDAQGYVIDTRRQDELTVPTRSTVKQFVADWCGPPRWSMPRPTGEPMNDRGESFLAFETDPSSKSLVTGTLVHDLPGPIRELRIVVNEGQAMIDAVNPDQIFDTSSFSGDASFEWDPGTPLNLASFTVAEKKSEARFDGWLRQTLQRATRGEGARQADERMIMLPFLGITPLPAQGGTLFSNATAVGLTSLTHGIELSAHLTQPCVIILGVVETDVSPTPI
ncbi:MAG: hypothetical protein KDA28_06105, partial [Phycisphaerales bacterium]|nr:hypothetical protein [Phycisphaerales bacterium]